MTDIARRPSVQMSAMAEEHIRRNLVDSTPSYRLGVLCGFRNFLNRGAVRLDGGMALHAYRRRRDAHRLPWVAVGVAHVAFQLQRPDVLLVTEWNRLRRSLRPDSKCAKECEADPRCHALTTSPQDTRKRASITQGSSLSGFGCHR